MLEEGAGTSSSPKLTRSGVGGFGGAAFFASTFADGVVRSDLRGVDE